MEKNFNKSDLFFIMLVICQKIQKDFIFYHLQMILILSCKSLKSIFERANWELQVEAEKDQSNCILFSL